LRLNYCGQRQQNRFNQAKDDTGTQGFHSRVHA
jgi:hypothetical protein